MCGSQIVILFSVPLLEIHLHIFLDVDTSDNGSIDLSGMGLTSEPLSSGISLVYLKALSSLFNDPWFGYHGQCHVNKC
jgi:hypothetical protein